MLLSSLFILSVSYVLDVAACPDHAYRPGSQKLAKRAADDQDYSYETPQSWGHIKPEYETCRIGMQQSPIDLNDDEEAPFTPEPHFNYSMPTDGYLENTGLSLSFNFRHADSDPTTLPSFSFQPAANAEPEEVYLIGWHLHTPSEHTIEGVHAMSEIHLVHADGEGKTRAVVGFLLAPRESAGNLTAPSQFFAQLPASYPNLPAEEPESSEPESYSDEGDDETDDDDDETTQIPLTIDPSLLLLETADTPTFWSYAGSLTTPPCTEGLRWFVAQQPVYLGAHQMQEVLRVGKFSSRPVQEVWGHFA